MTETYPSPQPLGAPAFSRLTPAQCQRIHQASLEILQRTGVRLYDQEALDLVRQAGAQVSDGTRARFPAGLVEQALAVAPKQVVLYDRLGRPAMPVAGPRTFFGPGSDCLHIVDHRTAQRRPPLLRDVIEGVTLCDALEHIDFVMSLFLPSDVSPKTADRYQMEAMLQNTTKPILFVSYDMSGCLDAVAMAEAAAGGAGPLREKPFVAGYVNSTTGLLHNTEALQKLLYLAEKGLPCIYVPGASAGLTEPVTVAASTAVKNAGALVGLVIAQLKRPGTPVIVPGWGSVAVDMRTLVRPYSAPDHRGVAEAMAHFYGLPMFSLAGATDAKVVDQQAASEAALTMLLEALAGGQIVHDLGYLESGLSGSLAQLAICDEIVGWIRHLTREIEVGDETLALDLIDQLGPEGQFVGTAHTRRHFAGHFYPRLFERENYGGWQAKGGKTLGERAAGRVEEILAAHRAEPLPEAVARSVHAIVERAGI
jgi:trimethylamine--corrinoid protein Co-methyltransferase